MTKQFCRTVAGDIKQTCLGNARPMLFRSGESYDYLRNTFESN